MPLHFIEWSLFLLNQIVREEGYRGLYKGMLTSIMGVAPYVAINFTTYETLKRYYFIFLS